MEKRYLENYYPQGISMEERLFEIGANNTRIPPSSWIAAIAAGTGIAFVGVLIASFSYSATAFGVGLLCIGGLVVLIGTFGLSAYYNGLRCLERAELLYNTRVAGRNEAQTQSTPDTSEKKAEATQAEMNWKCTCGKINASYMRTCACGITKQEAKQGKRAATVSQSVAPVEQTGVPVRTANGWRCSCGKEHPAFVSTCVCGVNKRDVK